MKTPMELLGVECGPGWYDIIKPLIEQCKKENASILQIKEKFGGLRFYISTGSPKLYKMIEEAEAESYKTCEECGKPGRLRSEGWMRTLCDDHAYEFGYDDGILE